ncbi:MAG: right-handed parallel beta-helix repeat-containing protein, partial [Alphaproteobacteria bacterium]
GYVLEIPAGTTLRFDADGAIIAYDPVRFMGTAEAPIVLEGGTATWQGISVVGADGQSEWAHVRVRNTTGISQGAWQLTGGVNFYKSDVRLADSTFEGHRGEDALNIISSAFEMDGVTIMDTASDGFDGDFTTGTIRNSVFRDIGKLGGGDAVDVSGSQVSVEGTRFERINDKALSVGEGSTMLATNLIMNDVGAGAASKDNSRLDVSNTEITGARVAGLMAYIKKPEYGGAEIVAEQVTIVDSNISARVQEGSRILLNGNPVVVERVDVEQLYETVMKPGTK